ncbi:DUF742 domain-containing protein [Spirillospora sp. NPDC029432]|uniref:DUF742 domain-containing protein n=1 Tax=Spirillospora sp. NPDC029432 TaxID=3154599 RepID=UPI003456DA57
MDAPRERWTGQDAGPVVRPYALTGGRTRPRGAPFDLVAILVATGKAPGERVRLTREQRRLLELCRRPSTPADLASEADLPLRVVQILLDDLRRLGLIERREPEHDRARPDSRILMRVLDELRRL